MKIVFMNNLYPPYIVGGNEMLAREVIEALRDRGHIVHVITGRGSRLPRDGFTHGLIDLDLDRKEDYFLGARQPTPFENVKWHLFNYRSYRAVRSRLLEIAPDLVVAWNLWVASMAPLIAARRTGFPLVIHTADRWLYYGLKDWSPLVGAQGRWKRRGVEALRRWVQPLLFRMAQPYPIITISEFIRKVYVDAGFDANEIEAVHLGIPLEKFHLEGRSIRDSGRVNFLYVGSLWGGKGAQVAIQALGRVIKKPGIPQLHLDFYGTGAAAFMEYLKQEVEKAGVKSHVTFHGFINRDELPDIQRCHDILLFPSIWDEPFAAVPVEAMACGTPVIGTTAGGTPEAIVDGVNGLLVPPNDADAMAGAMDKLIRDPELCWQLGQQAAREVREKFDFQTYIDRLERRYLALAGEFRG